MATAQAPQATGDELAALRAENEALRARLEQVSEARPSHRSARNGWAIVLVVVASLVMGMAVPAVWINRLITDTDAWVRTVAPLADDAAVQDYVTTVVSARIIEELDAQARLESVLPENLKLLAAPLANGVEGFVVKQTGNLVRSDQFSRLWTEVNRAGHTAFVSAVTGREGAVSVDSGAGRITLDVGVLVDRVRDRLVDSGFELAARIPSGSVRRSVVLYESPMLAQTTAVVNALSTVALALPLLGFALIAGAFALAVDRRKVALWLGAGLAIVAFLPLQAIYLGQYAAVTQLRQLGGVPAPAAQAVYTTLFRDLVTADRALLALGAVVLLAAVLAGPARWAVAMRAGLSGGLSGVASHLELGGFGEWVARHKAGLRAAGFIGAVAVLVVVPPPRTVASVLWTAAAVIVWLLLVELLGAAPGEDDA